MKKTALFILALLVTLFVINVLSFSFYTRVDFTEDQRYSISPSTKKLLDRAQKDIVIELLFDGSTSAEYQQLHRSVIETLEELKAYGGASFEYYEANPLDIENDSVQFQEIQKLTQYGIKQRFHAQVTDGERKVQRVFPGAIVRYGKSFFAINFIKNGKNGMIENFDQSVNEIEYELATAMNRLIDSKKRQIAFSEGHGELLFQNVFSLASELVKYGDVGQINIKNVPTIDSVDVLILAQPKEPFSDQDLYKIDQYVMRGGKVLFFLDELQLKADSAGFTALPYEHNLRPLLRKYGLRLEGNMVQDYNSEKRMITTENGQNEPLRYTFFPILATFSDHIITKGLNPLSSQYVGTIDTVKAVGVKKTPLVFTSKYTSVKGGDLVAYDINEMQLSQKEAYYNQQNLPVAYLSEGAFHSLFEHRPKPSGVNADSFIAQTDSGQVMLFADGELIKNNLDRKTGQPLEVGLSFFNRGMIYANKNFVSNTINYMLDNESVVNLKTKEIKLRTLDAFKTDESAERLKWQIINLVLPLGVVLFFALGRAYVRRRKYAVKS